MCDFIGENGQYIEKANEVSNSTVSTYVISSVANVLVNCKYMMIINFLSRHIVGAKWINSTVLLS